MSAESEEANEPPSASAPTTAREAAPMELLAGALTRLARGAPTDFTGLLHDVESHAIVGGTKVTAHCHCLKLDGNGRPRIEDLVNMVADHVLDYAIPRSRIREADEAYQRTKSTQKLVLLMNEAAALSPTSSRAERAASSCCSPSRRRSFGCRS